MEVGSGSSDFLAYAQKVNLATGGADSIPFGYDVQNVKAIAALKEKQDIIDQTKNNIKVSNQKFDNMNNNNNSGGRKGTIIDIYA